MLAIVCKIGVVSRTATLIDRGSQAAMAVEGGSPIRTVRWPNMPNHCNKCTRVINAILPFYLLPRNKRVN